MRQGILAILVKRLADLRAACYNSTEANALQKPYSISCIDPQIVSHYFSSKD